VTATHQSNPATAKEVRMVSAEVSASPELVALLATILDRAFKGEL
jgi:hypothetical protein